MLIHGRMVNGCVLKIILTQYSTCNWNPSCNSYGSVHPYNKQCQYTHTYVHVVIRIIMHLAIGYVTNTEYVCVHEIKDFSHAGISEIINARLHTCSQATLLASERSKKRNLKP